MKYSEIISEEKVRLDPKCWTGKKIGNPKTKMKGGVRVNNCVPAESVAEGQGNLAKALDTLRGSWSGWHQVDSYDPDIEKYEWDDGEGGFYAGGSIEHNLKTGEITVDYEDEYGDEVKGTFKSLGDAMRALRGGYPGSHGGKAPNFDRLGQRTPYGPDDLRKTDRTGRKGTVGGGFANARKASIQHSLGRHGPKGVLPEHIDDGDWNSEYDDEAGMADNNLETLRRAVDGIDNLIQPGDNLPEWCQEKIAQAKGMLVGVWDYMKSEQDRGATDELNEEFNLIEGIVNKIARHNGVDAEIVWESLDSLSDDELYVFAVTSEPIMESEAWQKANNRDKTDGMSRKAVKAYRREHPGSKLQTAVTTKPSKLKKGSKASKRRKSYCSRSRGQMKMHNISCAKTPDKAICKARRRWNC
jgi:hypothetical protein